MNTYRLETVATMKTHNQKKWWIDSGIVRPVRVQAENVKAALQLYRDAVQDRECITISKNALKNPAPMFIDGEDGEPEQIGYVITGKTDFDNDGRGWVSQYIDLWVTVEQVAAPVF